MSGIILLLALCAVMALASFMAGALPLSMSLSSSQLRLLSSIGVGVLVGTSLIIIIPEGIEAATSATRTTESIHAHRLRTVARRSPWGSGVNLVKFEQNDVPVIRTTYTNEPRAGSMPSMETRDDVEQPPTVEEPDHDHDHSHNEAHVEFPAFQIGVSLILGFGLMFLIDRLPKHASERFQQGPQTRHVSLENLGGDTSSVDEEAGGLLGAFVPNHKGARSMATTLGLVIHAAADGIAMGASSTTSDTQLGFIIFVAIMIHKAPASFGLTSVLLKQGLSKRAARGHLLVFSLAAPAGALTTWLLITILGGGNMDGDSGKWWTGMLLLFSGGTFLYVAMHAMNDEASHDHIPIQNGYADNGSASPRRPKGPRMVDTLATLGGMLLPLLAQVGGHHHH